MAAGGIPWRYDGNTLLLAVVHRPRYDDWSFPKGKLHPGELPVLAAVREVQEETGLSVRLGQRLPTTTYQADGTDKTVAWWSMPADAADDDFTANDEVDDLAWWPVDEAVRRLSYPDDVDLASGLEHDPPLVPRVLLVRHAQAGDRWAWTGPDDERPLDADGEAEAGALAEVLPWFGPTRILTAAPLRCRQTVQPLGYRLGLMVEPGPEFGEDAYWLAPRAARERLSELLADATAVSVVCSQGGAIPSLMSWLLSANPRVTGVSPRRTDPEPPCRKGSVWVLAGDTAADTAAARPRSADYYGTLLP